MRILLVSNLYPPVVYGGYEILCAQAADELRKRGHEVEVVTSGFRASEADTDPRVHPGAQADHGFPLARPGCGPGGFLPARHGAGGPA